MGHTRVNASSLILSLRLPQTRTRTISACSIQVPGVDSQTVQQQKQHLDTSNTKVMSELKNSIRRFFTSTSGVCCSSRKSSTLAAFAPSQWTALQYQLQSLQREAPHLQCYPQHDLRRWSGGSNGNYPSCLVTSKKQMPSFLRGESCENHLGNSLLGGVWPASWHQTDWTVMIAAVTVDASVVAGIVPWMPSRGTCTANPGIRRLIDNRL